VIQFIGTAREKSSVLSFLIEGIHPYDIGVLLDQQGIAVRTGHHCTQPVMDFYGIPGTVRASFSFYNDLEDIHRFSEGLKKSIKMLV
jgi:cysteine desulfurase/selenocysteine lyase